MDDEGKSLEGRNFSNEERNPSDKSSTTAVCRLCAQILEILKTAEAPQDENYVHLLKIVGSETVSSIIGKCLPDNILISLPESASPVVCLNCFQSLIDLLNFHDKICRGQLRLKKMEKVLVDSDALIPLPKRRGRPRKKEQAAPNKGVPSPQPLIESDSTIKTLRKRTGRLRCFDDESSILSLPALTSASDQPNSEALSSSKNAKKDKHVLEEVTVAVSLNGDKDCDEDMVMDAKDYDSTTDVTWSGIRQLKIFRRKRRKPGRPKNRKKAAQIRHFCDSCGKSYLTYSSLAFHKAHLHHHNENKSEFECNLCLKTFKYKALLTNHMFTHDDDSRDEENITCEEPECDQIFKTRELMQSHVLLHHHTLAKVQFPCETCGVQYPSKKSLATHRRIHLPIGERRFICQICDKTFYHKGNYDQHCRTHTKEKPFVCKNADCDKRFATSSQLKNHQLIHSKITAYLCPICGKGFHVLGTMKLHLKRLHNYPGNDKEGEDNNDGKECKYCFKRFSDRWSLRKHLRIHTKDKPYACQFCAKKFTDASNYSRHIKIHSKSSNETNLTNIPSDTTLTAGTQQAMKPNSSNPNTDSESRVEISTVVGLSSAQEPVPSSPAVQSDPIIHILTPGSNQPLATAHVIQTDNDENVIYLYPSSQIFQVSSMEHQFAEPTVQVPVTSDDNSTNPPLVEDDVATTSVQIQTLH